MQDFVIAGLQNANFFHAMQCSQIIKIHEMLWCQYLHLMSWLSEFSSHSANESSPQVIYQNVQQQIAEGQVCDESKGFNSPCDQSCDHKEEEQPLMKTNNYQFCWKPPKQQNASKSVTHQ